MNRKKRSLKSKHIYLIVLIVVVVIAILSYTVKTDKKLNTFESLIKDCVVEVQKLFYTPIRNFSTMISDFFSLKDVLEENKILKSNVEKIESLEAENIELKQEIDKMKEELNLDHILSDYDYLNATVVSRNSFYWYNTLTIDKGSHNGIKEGMVVINSTGLIGKIENVSTFSSDVKLITTNDTNNKISVTITNGDNKLTGLINAYDFNDGYLKVEGISNTATVNVGDFVYTSGLGGVFPSGILIGTVDSITTDVYDLSKIINVKPSADFDDINYVTILKRADS
ncbi:MAG: rod shape-determining protein MreC [Erysipelotrichaceae bacterium]|nr:rod shape-determining protein MreC [Erysipelotrichaceae bacterium]